MAGETIFVGCKAPNGLVLNLDHYEVVNQDKLAVQKVNGGRTVTLRGFAHKFNEPDPTLASGGYRMTPVPADFWAEWFKINRNSPLIVDKIILPPPSNGADKAGNGIAQARELAEVEKMNPPLKQEGDARAGFVKPYKPDKDG